MSARWDHSICSHMSEACHHAGPSCLWSTFMLHGLAWLSPPGCWPSPAHVTSAPAARQPSHTAHFQQARAAMHAAQGTHAFPQLMQDELQGTRHSLSLHRVSNFSPFCAGTHTV